MLFGVPTVFGKWLYFQYVIRFVLGKSLFLTFCFQDVPRFVVFREDGHEVAMQIGMIEASKTEP